MPFSLRAPLHPLPFAINLSSVHSKTSIFHSNSNEDFKQHGLGHLGQFRATSAPNLVPQRSSQNGLNNFLETSWHSSFGKSHEEKGLFLVTPQKVLPHCGSSPPFPPRQMCGSAGMLPPTRCRRSLKATCNFVESTTDQHTLPNPLALPNKNHTKALSL